MHMREALNAKFINCMSIKCVKTFISYIYFVAVEFLKVNNVKTL
jgi:hypothetical protein